MRLGWWSASLTTARPCTDAPSGSLDGDALNLRVFGDFSTSQMTLEAFAADVVGWHVPEDRTTAPLRGVLSVDRASGRVKGFFLNTTRTRHLRFERMAD